MQPWNHSADLFLKQYYWVFSLCYFNIQFQEWSINYHIYAMIHYWLKALYITPYSKWLNEYAQNNWLAQFFKNLWGMSGKY